MTSTEIITLDIGGTKINTGIFKNNKIITNNEITFDALASKQHVLSNITQCIGGFISTNTQAIALGVPCIVDTKAGIAYDAVNIPAWQEEPLKAQLERFFKLPVYINNDVNCFTYGEYKAAKHSQIKDMVGLCLGTGLGAGMIINGQLYQGHNCNAGEVGAISYLDGTIENYCSGQFFKDKYLMTGEQITQLAQQQDQQALQAFHEFGLHLGRAIAQIILMVDPQHIIIGGSVAKSFNFFIDALWQTLKAQLPSAKVLENLTICRSSQNHSALLGAAYLYIEHQLSNEVRK